jgi:hypothetical protein
MAGSGAKSASFAGSLDYRSKNRKNHDGTKGGFRAPLSKAIPT